MNDELITRNLNRVASAFSGSWQGYHANVYFQDFSAPSPGSSFSPEWGLMNPFGRRSPSGWRETEHEVVEAAVMKDVDASYEEELDRVSRLAKSAFDEAFDSLSSLVAVLIENKKSAMLEEIQDEAREIQGPVTKAQLIAQMSPKGTFMSRDTKSISQGTRIPPHVDVEARHMSMRSPFAGITGIIRLGRKLHMYMVMQDLIEIDASEMGNKVFIGHGQSLLWHELTDYIQNRLNLQWDEFNREPAAGLATTERLRAMMDDACFAFLILTAEDQHSDKSIHARENVVHEVGLFQGKLDFRRAIVLIEEGCSEFSNISGLSQIRFPKGNIRAIFEDVRRVLEREKVL